MLDLLKQYPSLYSQPVAPAGCLVISWQVAGLLIFHVRSGWKSDKSQPCLMIEARCSKKFLTGSCLFPGWNKGPGVTNPSCVTASPTVLWWSYVSSICSPIIPFLCSQRGWSNRECNLLSCKGLEGLSNLPLFVLRHLLDYEFAYKVTEESDRYLAGWLFWSYNKHGQKSPVIKLLHNYCCATDYVTNLLRVKEIIFVGLRDLVSSRSSRMNQICWSQERTTIKMQYFLKFPPPRLTVYLY